MLETWARRDETVAYTGPTATLDHGAPGMWFTDAGCATPAAEVEAGGGGASEADDDHGSAPDLTEDVSWEPATEIPNLAGTRADQGGSEGIAYTYESFEHYMRSRGGLPAGTAEDQYRWSITPALPEEDTTACADACLGGATAYLDDTAGGRATVGAREGAV